MKNIAFSFTEKFAKQLEKSIERLYSVGAKLQLVYAAESMLKVKDSVTEISQITETEPSLEEYPETMLTGKPSTLEAGAEMSSVCDNDRNRTEYISEIDELEKKLEETEGEFDFSAVPPLFTSVLKAGSLHVCSPEELARGAACRWDPVMLVMTDRMLFLHSLNDQQRSSVAAAAVAGTVFSDIDICKSLIGILPSQSIHLSKIQVSLLLHPVFSDTFELTSSQGNKVTECQIY
jgi:hypothetical protein